MQQLPISVGVCISGSGSSFRYLCENDPNYGTLYKFVGVFSDVPTASGLAYAKERGIPTASIDFTAWRQEHGIERRDLTGRVHYFHEALDLMRDWSEPPDVLMCSGFMLRITNPWLSYFPGWILNVHPALLSLCDDEGRRKYTGLHVVERAMKAGDPTGSTVHIVSDEPDMGPIITQSNTLSYDATTDPAAHQERMKTECDGPAYVAAFAKLIMMHDWPRKPWMNGTR